MVSKEYLEDERVKLWAAVSELKESLEKRTSDYESNAKQASRKASEYRNRSLEAKQEIDGLLESVNANSKRVSLAAGEAEKFEKFISERNEELDVIFDRIERFESKLLKVEEIFNESDVYEQRLAKLVSICERSEQELSKVNAAATLVAKRKKEFDELYYEIFGYEVEDDETGEARFVDGTKDKLESSYDDLKNEITEARAELTKSLSKFEEDSTLEFEKNESTYKEQSDKWSIEYSSIVDNIRSLLPDALTAGLSSAFSDKRLTEIEEGNRYGKVFNYSIIGLVLVSLLPVSLNLYLFSQGESLESIVADMPKVLSAIIPLYLPLVWLAYSSSKKSNLSKRLVEEYTHKEVLSKTYEGLSSQIDDLGEDDISKELRSKLLYNLLDVSSENPGKLISNYDKSDHPLMDVLDRSAKLNIAIDSLARVPGLQKLARIVERKQVESLKRNKAKVEDALDQIDDGSSV